MYMYVYNMVHANQIIDNNVLQSDRRFLVIIYYILRNLNSVTKYKIT